MSSNLNDANNGPSQSPPPYFQNNAFGGFDPALSSNNDTGSLNHQPWSYQPDQLGLAHPQTGLDQHHQNDSNLYQQQQQWHHPSNSNHFQPNTENEFQSAYFANSFATPANPTPSFHHSTFSSSQGYGRDIPDHLQFQQSFSTQTTSQSSPYNLTSPSYPQNAGSSGTIAPQELEHKQQPRPVDSSHARANSQSDTRVRSTFTEQHMHSRLPPGKDSGNFLVTSVGDLEGAFQSYGLHKFVHVGTTAQDVSITKSTLPAYVPRKSRNEIMKLLASDSSLKAKLNKKLAKKVSGGAPKSSSARAPFSSSSKAAAVKPRASDSPSADGSEEDESASSSSEEESILPPLPATRPSKPVEAVKYDTIKALWRVPYRSALGDDIRKGLADFWEVAKTIRERWKSDASAVKQAEEAKKINELPLLRERVASQRDMLEAALRAALAEGHKDIIEHLGENLPLMNALAVSLQDRARDADYNGGLSKAILEILSRCKTMTDGNLDKTGISKIIPRFVKRGDDIVKTFAKRITDNAATASKKRKEANKTSSTTASQARNAKPIGIITQTPGSPTAGTKRPRENETRPSQPIKKVAAGPASVALNQADQPLLKKASIATDAKAPATTTAAAKKVVTKSTNFFSSLQPAYKKPAAHSVVNTPAEAKSPILSITEKIPIQSAATAVALAATTSQSKPAFSFAETMANLTRPKEAEPAPKKEDSALLETPEEKAKRLRKEQRRSLRVSFKPESELVDIRYFVHDPEEEQGHDASQVRDVGDLESEGRMFKLQHQEDQDRMDLDEDEDDMEDQSDDFDSKAFVTPSLVDFSDIPEEERERNYMPFGGGINEPESPDSETQKQREADTLLVVYAQQSDIPPSPKEPPESTEEATTPKTFGAPPEDVMSRLRIAKEIQAPPSQSSLPISTTDLSALIGSLTKQSQQPLQPQQPSSQLSDLEKLVAQFKQSQPQQQQPLIAPHHSGTPNFYGGPSQQSQNPYLQTTASQPNTGAAVDVSALLASLQGQMPSTTPQVPNILGSLVGYGQQQNQQSQLTPQPQSQQQQRPQQQQQQQYPYENEERRRWREGGAVENDQPRQWQNKKPPRDPNRPTPKFVLPCKYFKEGKCIKGANCTYRHDL